jgi:CMP-N-acetylneuraminic acid synthetase
MNKKILGIIPARGGSKSIPRKNIKLFAGKPLINWSIETGLKSGILDRLIVSTDDQEIAGISQCAGAEIPFMRPGELAEETTPTLSVLQHAVTALREKEGYNPDYILLMEATSPCRQPFHLREAVKILEETGADSVVALGEVPKHFSHFWQFNIGEENKIELFTGGSIKNIIHRRQELPTTYFRNGAFYLFKTNLLFAPEPSLYGEDVRGYVIDSKYSVDIDTLEDWELAERTFKALITE